jgi:hypothetical protein
MKMLREGCDGLTGRTACVTDVDDGERAGNT